MKIKVTETREASPNGYEVNTYKEGVVYDMPKDLADVFIEQSWGKEVPIVVNTKAVTVPLKNKMVAEKLDNKKKSKKQ